jgi:ketosteroid isomerase-like protein
MTAGAHVDTSLCYERPSLRNGMANELSDVDAEAAIRALEDSFAAAFNAGNVDAMMKNYVSDESLVVFDVVPPRQHLGADAYRKAWAGFFAHFSGTPKIAITDLAITVDGKLGFSHSIQHVTGADKQGRPVDRTVRVTDGYRKVGGAWLIVLEHVSVPVDLATGKPDVDSKP